MSRTYWYAPAASGLHHLMDVAVARLVVGAPARQADVLTGDVMTSGPVTNMTLVAHRHHRSVWIGGLSPAHLPKMMEICGTSPHRQFMAAPQLGVPGQRGDGVLGCGRRRSRAGDRAADHRATPGHLA